MGAHTLTPFFAPQIDVNTTTDSSHSDVEFVPQVATVDELNAALIVARRNEAELNAYVAVLQRQLDDVRHEMSELMDIVGMYHNGVMTPHEAFGAIVAMVT